jgi:hypothetical protein
MTGNNRIFYIFAVFVICYMAFQFIRLWFL